MSKNMVYTCFRRTRAAINRFRLLPLFESWALAEGYATAYDWLLCRLWPEYGSECRAYYQGTGEKFELLHHPDIRRIDTVMAECVCSAVRLVVDAGLPEDRLHTPSGPVLQE